MLLNTCKLTFQPSRQLLHLQCNARAPSPSFFANLSSKASRSRNMHGQTPIRHLQLLRSLNHRQSIELTRSQNAYKEPSAVFCSINSRYPISWEYANLLIELGGAGGAATNESVISALSTSASAPSVPHSQSPHGIRTKKSRKRPITLASDDETKPTQTLFTVSGLSGSNRLPGSALHANRPSNDPPLASPPNNSWRALTGRHDLSQRQLVLL